MFCSKCGRQIPDGSVCPCQQAAPAAAPASRPVAPVGGLFAKITLSKVIAIFVTILTFGLGFINWYKLKDVDDSGFGPYAVEGSAGLGDISWLMVVVQILLIINIIVFATYLISSVINFNVLVPALRKLDLAKLLHKAFYFILILCLVLGFIGALTGYYSSYDSKSDFEKEFEKDHKYAQEYYEENPDEAAEYYTEMMEDNYDYDGRELKDFDDYMDAMWDQYKVESTLAAGWYVTLVFALIGLVFVIKPNVCDDFIEKIKAANAAALREQAGQPYTQG